MKRYYLQTPNYESKTDKLYLAAPAFITKADETTGRVEAFVSVMGNVDLQDDIIHMGAFTKTIQEKGTDFRVLDNHSFWSILDALGTCVGIEEKPRRELPKMVQEKFPDAMGGLWTDTQFMLDDERSMAAFRRLKSGAINQYSIGFQIVKQDFTEEDMGDEDNPMPMMIRNIREIRLWEYSLVLFAANPATATAGIKNVPSMIPVTLDNIKRAETKKSCANCIFFGKFASDIGYCKKHEGTTKSNAICDTYEGTLGTTYADAFEAQMHDSLTKLFTTWKPNMDLMPSVPAMVQAMTRMLPEVAHDTVYNESQPNPSPEPLSTPDKEAAPKTALTEIERKALVAKIEQRHNQQKQKMKGVV